MEDEYEKNETKLKKKIQFSLCIMLILTCICTLPVYAIDISDGSAYISYDMNAGGKQVFQITNEEGEDFIIIVTQIESVSRVANGAYQIDYVNPGSWKAGFKISVANNTITSAYGRYYETITGRISDDVLTLDNTKRASYRFIYHYAVIPFKTGVYCVIDGTNIKIGLI